MWNKPYMYIRVPSLLSFITFKFNKSVTVTGVYDPSPKTRVGPWSVRCPSTTKNSSRQCTVFTQTSPWRPSYSTLPKEYVPSDLRLWNQLFTNVFGSVYPYPHYRLPFLSIKFSVMTFPSLYTSLRSVYRAITLLQESVHLKRTDNVVWRHVPVFRLHVSKKSVFTLDLGLSDRRFSLLSFTRYIVPRKFHVLFSIPRHTVVTSQTQIV